MAKTVEILYKDGLPVDIWESMDGEPRQYGSCETPDRGYLVIRMFCEIKDLPVELTQFGFGSAKKLLDETLMSVDEKSLFKDAARFTWKQHTVKHTITPERLVKLVKNNTDDWDAVLTARKDSDPLPVPIWDER